MSTKPAANPAVESLEQRVMMSATDLAVCATTAPLIEHSPGCGCGGCQTIHDSAGELTVIAAIDDTLWMTLVDSCGILELDDHDHVDANGLEFHDTPGADGRYADAGLAEAALRAQIDAWLKEAGVAIDGDTGQVEAATTASGVPILHSNPAATVKLYLDFDGHYEASWGSYGATNTPAYDIDGNAGSFSATEISRITEIWARVAEDYAPFNIDVTTEEPPSFANGQALRVAIGGSSMDWYGKSAGGVAYINSFTNSVANVAYVFEDQLGNGNAKYVAEAVSHEAGHSFGMRHQAVWDGDTKTADYDTGSNGWAPIMGVGYYQERTTWQYGKNSSGAMQDDLAVLSGSTNGFGYRADDHAASNGSATVLSVNSDSGAFTGSGIIERNGDVDAFRVRADSGTLNVAVSVAQHGANLDATLEIYNAQGQLVASASPSTTLGASLSVNVSAGDYFIRVSGGSSYGSLGQYTLTGTAPTGGAQSVGPEVAVSFNGNNIADGSTNPISFGTVTKGEAGSSLTFTVRNDGDQTLNLSGLTAPSGFTITSGLPSSLAAGGSATFTVRLDSSTVGTKSGQITFTNNDADESLFNFAVTGHVAAGPEVTVLLNGANIVDGSTNAIDFGTVTKGAAGSSLTFTVRNDGDQTLNLSGLTAPSGFTITSGLPASLAAGGSATFTVRLDATTAGAKSGQLTFASNDADESLFNFAIAGHVAAGPEVAVLLNGTDIADGSTNAIDFGTITKGQTGNTLTFTVRNDGDQTLNLSGLTAPSGFTITSGLPSSLAAGGSTTFTVRLDATAAGTKSGQLAFTTNDADESLFNFAITGRVMNGPEVTVLLGSTSIADGATNAIDFGTVTSGQTGSSRTFTVRNDGDQSLSLSGLTAPAGFTITSGLPSSLAAGASATFTVRLDASGVGDKSGHLAFATNDADESLFNFAITGRVAAGPEVTVLLNGTNIADGSTSAIDFGSVTRGESGPTRTFTVRNDGDQTLTLSGLTAPSGFTITDGLPSSLAAGSSATFTVQLDSNASGTMSGQIAFSTNDADEATFNFAITGSVAEPNFMGPEITVLRGNTVLVDGQSGAIDFGSVRVGTTGPSLTFTVRNDGDQTLNLTDLSVPAGFSVTSGLPSSLAAGSSATFTVRLDSASVGTSAGRIMVTSNDADEAVFDFAVTGRVMAGPEVAVLLNGSNIADGSTSAIDFGSVTLGDSGSAITFTVRNDGDMTLNLSGLAAPSGFTITGGLPGSLVAGASTTFTVRLDADATGVKSGQIGFTTNDSDESLFNFAVTGRVMAGPEVTVLFNGTNIADGSTSPIDFGSVTLGGVGSSRTFTVRNDGDQTLDLSGLGAPAGFTITGDLPGSLAAGASTTFTVRLDAASTGTKTGQISFTTNDRDEALFNFAVAGTVAEPQYAGPDVTVMLNGNPIADGSTDPIDFGSVTVGQSGRSLTFTVRNDGDQALNLSQLKAPAGFTITGGLPASLAVGDSATFTVRLDASAAGVKAGVLSFVTNDADEPLFDFAVSGTVMVGPDIAVRRGNADLTSGSNTAVDFGSVIEGDAGSSITFTVVNRGDQTLNLTGLTAPTGFTVTKGLPSSLAAGDSATFTVRLDSTVVGDKSGVVAVASNDADTPAFTFSVAGEVDQQQNTTRENRLGFDASQGGWYFDSDGDKVSISISGRGTGRILLDENGNAAGFAFTGTDSRTNIAITTDGGGDNKAVVGSISIDGSLRRFDAPTTWLTGDFTITGSIKFANLASIVTDGGDSGGGTTSTNGKGRGSGKKLADSISGTDAAATADDSDVSRRQSHDHDRVDRFRIRFSSETVGRYRTF